MLPWGFWALWPQNWGCQRGCAGLLLLLLAATILHVPQFPLCSAGSGMGPQGRAEWMETQERRGQGSLQAGAVLGGPLGREGVLDPSPQFPAPWRCSQELMCAAALGPAPCPAAKS